MNCENYSEKAKTENADSQLLYVNFNQDYSCLAAGTSKGFAIYNCDPFGLCYERLEEDSGESGGIGMCEMLFTSSLVAIVGTGGMGTLAKPPTQSPITDPSPSGQPESSHLSSQTLSPRKLHVINTKRQTVVCELSFPTKILAILMNRKRLVIVLESKLHIYDLSTMKIVHTIDIPSNPNGK